MDLNAAGPVTTPVSLSSPLISDIMSFDVDAHIMYWVQQNRLELVRLYCREHVLTQGILLDKAAGAGHIEMVQLLVDMGAKLRSFNEWTGQYSSHPPILSACISNHCNIVELLLPLSRPLTPWRLDLAEAAAAGGLAMYQLLEADLELTPQQLPLITAVKYGQFDLVQYLLAQGAFAAATAMDKGLIMDELVTHAMVSCRWRQLFVDMVAQVATINNTAPTQVTINITPTESINNTTPTESIDVTNSLHRVIIKGNIELTDLLLTARGNVAKAVKTSTYDPLTHVIMSANVDMSRFLLEHPLVVVSAERLRNYIIQIGTRAGNAWDKYIPLVHLILAKCTRTGVDVSVTDGHGSGVLSPLSMAASPRVLEDMLAWGISPNRPHCVGSDVLAGAIMNLNPAVVRVLLQAGADMYSHRAHARMNMYPFDGRSPASFIHVQLLMRDHKGQVKLPECAYVHEHAVELAAITNRCQPLSLFDTIRRYLYTETTAQALPWLWLPEDVVSGLKSGLIVYEPTITWSQHLAAMCAQSRAD